VPQDGDILSFVGTSFSTITNVPSLHLSKLVNDGGQLLFFGVTAGTILKIDNTIFNNEIGFASAGPIDVIFGNVIGGISKRLSYGFYLNATVTGTFIDHGVDFHNGWIPSALTFARGSVYKADFDISNIPAATWLPGSVVSITGIAASNQINNTSQVFYDFYLDSPAANASSILLGNITCLGTFGVKTIGGVSINNGGAGGNYNLNHLYLNDGTMYITYNGILDVTGNINQTGGVFMQNNGQFNLVGSSNQEVLITNPGNCNISVANTGALGKNIISLTGNTLFNSLDINLGIVKLNQFTHTILGSLTSMSATGGNMLGSSLSGLVFPGNPGGTTTIPPGTATLGQIIMNRQYSNSVYLGGDLTVTGSLKTYDNGDLDLNGNKLVISGWMVRNSGGVDIVGASASTLIFTNGSAYVHNFDGGNIVNASWLAGSTCSITGVVNNGPANLANQNFYNLVWNSPSQAQNQTLLGSSSDNLSVSGTLKLINMGNSFLKIKNGNPGTVGDIMINNYFQSSGILRNDQYGGPQGYNSFTIYGNISMTGGLFSLSVNGDYSGGYPLILKGGNSTIGITGGTFSGISNLTIQKDAGASIMLDSDLALGYDLTFLNGKITTGTNTLWVAGTVNGASPTTGWVNGKLAKNISTGLNKIAMYEVGTATIYSPFALTFPDVSTAGYVVASMMEGNNPNVGLACINQDKSINKYWTINTVGGSSLSPFNFNASFMYNQTTDVDAGTNLSNVQAFVYDGTNWSVSSSIPIITSTTIGLSGLLIPGEYYLAETAPKVSTITGPSMICMNGTTSVYSVAGNNCSTSFLWSIIGGNFTTTGNTISVIWTAPGIHQLGTASSDGISISAPNMLNVTVSSGAPTTLLSSISGMQYIALSAQVITYNAISVLGVNYMWTISGGGTLTASNNTASVVWTMPGMFTISTMPFNDCGMGLISTITVTVVSVGGVNTLPGLPTTISIISSSNNITTNKGTLQLMASISPANSTITTVSWSVSDTTIAKIDASGLVTAVANGVITVTAFATVDASIQSMIVITISNQGNSGTTTGISNLLSEISIYPNPATTSFTINALVGNYIVDIYSLQGVSLSSKVISGAATFSSDGLNAGTYLVKVQSGDALKTFRLVINK
jgi:hypothetical protein